MHHDRIPRWLDVSSLQAAAEAAPPSRGWQHVPPHDPFDPTTDEMADVLAGADGWVIGAASRRGKLHAHGGAYREDAFMVTVQDNWHLVAVADGAGSQPLARVGATIVCAAMIAGLRRGLQIYWSLPYPPQEILRLVLLGGLTAARAALDHEVEQRGLPVTHFASTLLVIMHNPVSGYVATIQIGDGALVAVLENREVIPLADAQSGAHAGETQFFGDVEPSAWPHYLRVHQTHTPPQMIVAMTDGVADDMLPFPRYLPELGDEVLAALDGPEPQEALLTVLQYEKPGSSDDRTLVVLAR